MKCIIFGGNESNVYIVNGTFSNFIQLYGVCRIFALVFVLFLVMCNFLLLVVNPLAHNGDSGVLRHCLKLTRSISSGLCVVH